jgi:hypothetical protein
MRTHRVYRHIIRKNGEVWDKEAMMEEVRVVREQEMGFQKASDAYYTMTLKHCSLVDLSER